MILNCEMKFDFDMSGWKYLSENSIKQIMSNDSYPFIATILALKEGMGKLERDIPREYTKNAVYSFSDLCIGKEMYLGHISPEERPLSYRVPVAKILASKVRTITRDDVTKINGIELTDVGMLGCFIKVYVSSYADRLRQHIKELMSTSVSIDGDAAVAMKDSNVMLVDRFSKVYSVDFCNNGTEGISGMGVIEYLEDFRDNVQEESVKTLLNFQIQKLNSKGNINLEEKKSIDLNKKKLEIIINKCRERNIKESLIEVICYKLSDKTLYNIENVVDNEINIIESLYSNKENKHKINLSDILDKRLLGE